VNILDKKNWDLFGVYALLVWCFSLILIPGIVYLLSYAGARLSKTNPGTRNVFLASTGALLPLGLMMWIAFVIPMLFVNVTFIIQSISDPFGWGWDFFGTANIPWHQFIPEAVPWFQSGLILTGLYFSLRNLRNTWLPFSVNPAVLLKMILPTGLFITATSIALIFFYTN
jgi:hypothetical protein